jgi:hypothetical protein
MARVNKEFEDGGRKLQGFFDSTTFSPRLAPATIDGRAESKAVEAALVWGEMS